MKKNLEEQDIRRLLAEADELIQKINSDFIKEMKDEHRLQVEIRAQHLEKMKSEIWCKIENKDTSPIGSGAEGMHEAIDDMVKAITDLKNYLF